MEERAFAVIADTKVIYDGPNLNEAVAQALAQTQVREVLLAIRGSNYLLQVGRIQPVQGTKDFLVDPSTEQEILWELHNQLTG